MEEIELSEQCRLGNNRARKELYEQYAGRMPVSYTHLTLPTIYSV